MSEFIDLYLELLKRRYHTEYTVTTLDSKEETEKYRNERENGILLNRVLEIQSKKNNVTLENPTLIISSSKYTTDILVGQFKRYFVNATYNLMDDIQVEDIEKFKYIVFVIDSESKSKMVKLLKEHKISSKILLITEQAVLKRKIAKKFRKSSNHIIGELFFKITFKICSIPVRKQEPSEKSIRCIRDETERILYGERKDP